MSYVFLFKNLINTQKNPYHDQKVYKSKTNLYFKLLKHYEKNALSIRKSLEKTQYMIMT